MLLAVAMIFITFFIIMLIIREINDKNEDITIESDSENIAIKRMMQESLFKEQETQKNKSHSVRQHTNDLFDDGFANDFDDDELTNPAYSNIAGNIFYHDD